MKNISEIVTTKMIKIYLKIQKILFESIKKKSNIFQKITQTQRGCKTHMESHWKNNWKS